MLTRVLLFLITCRALSVSAGHTSPGRAAETPRHSQPCSSQAAKEIRSIQHIWGAKSELNIETEPWLTLGSGFVSTRLLAHQLMAWSWIFKSKVLPEVVLQHQNSSPTAVILLSVPTEESVPICTNSLAITEALGDNRKGLSGFNLKLCVLIS